jgi:hypothetical protein
MADYKPEVEIAFERNVIATRFQSLPHIFDHARSAFVIADIARHPGTTGSQIADTKPEAEIAFARNVIATRFQSLPHIFYHARPACITTDIGRHPRTTGSQNGGL